jgi:hypothetical protein
VNLTALDWNTASLWLAVILAGLYHGVNPGMGWPLAVSAGMFGKGLRSLWPALAALALGHLAAMTVILLPFSALASLVLIEREIRLGAGALVAGFGLFLLIRNRHPRFLARIAPSRVALWSFLAALTHGAALMLVPLYLGICRAEQLDAGHRAAFELMAGRAGLALAVAIVHTLAMAAAGSALAVLSLLWFGPGFVRSSWFNLERLWSASLVLVGVAGVLTAMTGH